MIPELKKLNTFYQNIFTLFTQECIFIACEFKETFSIGSEHKNIINWCKDNHKSSNWIFLPVWLAHIIHYYIILKFLSSIS